VSNRRSVWRRDFLGSSVSVGEQNAAVNAMHVARGWTVAHQNAIAARRRVGDGHGVAKNAFREVCSVEVNANRLGLPEPAKSYNNKKLKRGFNKKLNGVSVPVVIEIGKCWRASIPW
jgi:hypothetical protein